MDFESKWYQQAAAIREKHKVSLSFKTVRCLLFLFVFCFVYCVFVVFVCFFGLFFWFVFFVCFFGVFFLFVFVCFFHNFNYFPFSNE